MSHVVKGFAEVGACCCCCCCCVYFNSQKPNGQICPMKRWRMQIESSTYRNGVRLGEVYSLFSRLESKDKHLTAHNLVAALLQENGSHHSQQHFSSRLAGRQNMEAMSFGDAASTTGDVSPRSSVPPPPLLAGLQRPPPALSTAAPAASTTYGLPDARAHSPATNASHEPAAMRSHAPAPLVSHPLATIVRHGSGDHVRSRSGRMVPPGGGGDNRHSNRHRKQYRVAVHEDQTSLTSPRMASHTELAASSH